MDDVILYSKCFAAGVAGVAAAMALVTIAGIVMALLHPLPEAPDLDFPDAASENNEC